MPGAGLDRFGLTADPFQHLASEALAEPGTCHVETDTDRALDELERAVLDGERRGFVLLAGPVGAGKTHRLRLAAERARGAGALDLVVQVGSDPAATLRGLASDLQAAAELRPWTRLVTPPRWYRDLGPVVRGRSDPAAAGRAVAQALGANAPAFLLLNDLHNLPVGPDADAFHLALHEVVNASPAGVLVLATLHAECLARLEERHTSLVSRADRVLSPGALGEREAVLLLAKRLVAHRMVEGIDPLFPFTEDAVREMNRAVGGNPRRLLKLAGHVLENAVLTRARRVDADLVVACALQALGRLGEEPAPA